MSTLRVGLIGWSTLALLSAAGCQLNDHDSAEPAPDEPREEGTAWAQACAGGSTSARRPGSGRGSDAASNTGGNGPASRNMSPDASRLDLDASLMGMGGSDAGLPTLPTLDAGALTPANFGTAPGSTFLGSPDAAPVGDAMFSPSR